MLDLQLQARYLALSAISCNNWKYPQFDVTVIISDEVNFFSWNAIHTCSATKVVSDSQLIRTEPIPDLGAGIGLVGPGESD